MADLPYVPSTLLIGILNDKLQKPEIPATSEDSEPDDQALLSQLRRKVIAANESVPLDRTEIGCFDAAHGQIRLR